MLENHQSTSALISDWRFQLLQDSAEKREMRLLILVKYYDLIKISITCRDLLQDIK